MLPEQSVRHEEISIHALREEGDVTRAIKGLWQTYFYPRPPRGGRLGVVGSRPGEKMISIHALREEGDTLSPCWCANVMISIHALREEGDSKNRDKISIFKQIIQHSARI